MWSKTCNSHVQWNYPTCCAGRTGGKDDEVIVPTLTYISTANVVLYQGAKLILWNVTQKPIVSQQKFKTSYYKKNKGYYHCRHERIPIDYDSINKLADNNIAIISDSAESLGANYRKPVGNQALVHSFSFFGNKNVTTGEGGMLTTDDTNLDKELRILRNQGQETL